MLMHHRTTAFQYQSHHKKNKNSWIMYEYCLNNHKAEDVVICKIYEKKRKTNIEDVVITRACEEEEEEKKNKQREVDEGNLDHKEEASVKRKRRTEDQEFVAAAATQVMLDPDCLSEIHLPPLADYSTNMSYGQSSSSSVFTPFTPPIIDTPEAPAMLHSSFESSQSSIPTESPNLQEQYFCDQPLPSPASIGIFDLPTFENFDDCLGSDEWLFSTLDWLGNR